MVRAIKYCREQTGWGLKETKEYVENVFWIKRKPATRHTGNPFSQYHISDVKRAFQIPVHWHDELEIIYVKQGKLHVTISGENYIGSPKDAFVVSPGSLHLMGSPTGDADYYTFLFPLEYISFQTDDLMENQSYPLSNEEDLWLVLR